MTVRIKYLADQPYLAPQVAGWLFREWFRGLGLSPEKAEEVVRARAQCDQLPVGLVALDDGQLVGTVSLAQDTLPGAGEWSPFLAGAYVVPAARGRGIGAQLCRRALVEARRLGVEQLYLYTERHETFYARLGWSKIAETLLEMGDAQQVVTLMIYPLQGHWLRRW